MDEDHEHDFSEAQWPFDEPIDVGALTTVNIAEAGDPILLVTHDADDGCWQILCGKTNDLEDGLFVCLGCLFDLDPSLGELADLPKGWFAWRESNMSPWQRKPRTT